MWGGSELNEHTPHVHRPNTGNVKCIIYTVYTLPILSTHMKLEYVQMNLRKRQKENDREFISVVRW